MTTEIKTNFCAFKAVLFSSRFNCLLTVYQSRVLSCNSRQPVQPNESDNGAIIKLLEEQKERLVIDQATNDQ